MSSLSDFNIVFNSFLVHRTGLRLVYKLIAEASRIFFFASSKCFHIKISHHPSLYFTLSPYHLFISPSLSTHFFISLTSSSPQLIVPLISYLNPMLEFYFGPFVVLLRFMFQRCNIFLSLLLDWIYLWI